jgi:TRAP transporter TAXI family solute receptor
MISLCWSLLIAATVAGKIIIYLYLKEVDQMMKKGAFLILVSIFLLSASAGDCRAQKPAPPKNVSLRAGATMAASSLYVYWVVLGSVLKKGIPGIDYTVVESGGSIENTNRLLQGLFEIIQANTVVHQAAYAGIGEWAKNKEKGRGLRHLFPMAVSPQPLFILADSKVETIYDLNGKKVAPGGFGSSTAECWHDIFGALGVKPDFYEASMSDTASLAKERKLVGFAKGHASTKIPDSLVLDVKTKVPLKLLNISEKDRKKLMAQFPQYAWFKFKASMFQEGAEDVYVPGWTMSVGTHKDAITDEVAYWLTKTAYQAKAELVKGWAPADIDWLETIKTFKVPLHAGAARFFKELNWDIPAHMIPPEYKP